MTTTVDQVLGNFPEYDIEVYVHLGDGNPFLLKTYSESQIANYEVEQLTFCFLDHLGQPIRQIKLITQPVFSGLVYEVDLGESSDYYFVNNKSMFFKHVADNIPNVEAVLPWGLDEFCHYLEDVGYSRPDIEHINHKYNSFENYHDFVVVASQGECDYEIQKSSSTN